MAVSIVKLEVGDYVRCTRGFEGAPGFVVRTDRTYIVTHVGKSTIEVSGIAGLWPACRFQLIIPTPSIPL